MEKICVSKIEPRSLILKGMDIREKKLAKM